MIYTCYKYLHRFLPFIPRIYYRRNVFEWEAVLDNECKYDIDSDQSDWNKLVGVSNSIFPRKESVRFVWRYNKDTNKFDIGGYVEKDREFTSRFFTEVSAGEVINMKLVFIRNGIAHMTVNGVSYDVVFTAGKIKYRLNPYFGGNRTAPHTMKLKLKSI